MEGFILLLREEIEANRQKKDKVIQFYEEGIALPKLRENETHIYRRLSSIKGFKI
ncbi:Uncharacterised protein [Mycobacteroides abscessus subsp. abscessus]|nr:Uncharacterised protein [Mycobacteroides abscessus subsp. abscessus]